MSKITEAPPSQLWWSWLHPWEWGGMKDLECLASISNKGSAVMFVSRWDAGTWCPEEGERAFALRGPSGLLYLSGISLGRLAQFYFTTGFQADLELAPWRQAQLEPPTSPWQVIVCAWTQHPPGTIPPRENAHLGLLNCLFPGLSQDRSRTWAHTGRQYESHTLCSSAHRRPGWGACLGLPLQFLSVVVT